MAIVLAAFFVLVGSLKLVGAPGAHWEVRLSQWGYPAGSRYAIGGAEILAGLGLLVPSFRRWAAIVLMAVMAGALLTHLVHREFVRILLPLILGGLSYWIYSWQPRSMEREPA